jgi:hypothetical protein
MEIVPPPGAQPLDPSMLGTAPIGGVIGPERPLGPMVAPTNVPQVSIPAVDAVEAVTLSPFIRGALVGSLVGAAVVGALWWSGGRR